MKTVSTVMFAVAVLVLASTATAQDDNAKKIVGTWVVDKANDHLPAGSTAEFTKDGKMKVVVKVEGQELTVEGTYKVEKDKMTVNLTFGDEKVTETITIKKITDDVMEIEDKDKMVTTFKKKKD